MGFASMTGLVPARTEWPPPFERLPMTDKRTLRLRAIRDGLIISGWLATAFCLVVVTWLVHSMGYDAYAYWSVDFSDVYGRAVSGQFFTVGSFRYGPPIAFLFGPAAALPWWLFLWLWLALTLALVAWLGGRWALVLLALPPVALELYHGNIHLLMAAAIVLGFRYPWTWAFVVVSKLTPGVGLLWFAVRREWRSLAIALGATGAVSLASYVVAPHYWVEWLDSIVGNMSAPLHYSVPLPVYVRLPLAALVVIWGARTDRPWTVAVAATLGLPIIWPHGLCVLAAAIPFLRRDDRAATAPHWLSAVQPRKLALSLAVFVGGALVLGLAFAGPISHLMEWASSNFYRT